MTEKAELARLHACFHRLSAAHKREILVKVETLINAGAAARKTAKRAGEKRVNKKRH